jgi:hypothetical protein
LGIPESLIANACKKVQAFGTGGKQVLAFLNDCIEMNAEKFG